MDDVTPGNVRILRLRAEQMVDRPDSQLQSLATKLKG
jgi:hypothetical protein